MKKKLIRILCLALCLFLLPSIALAQNGVMADVALKVYNLMFQTDNVTLTLKSDFTWDGEWFKTLDGMHMQDGTSSRLEISLTSPKSDGTTYTGGYTVTSVSGLVLSTETYSPHMYRASNGPLRSSVLTDTAFRRSARWLMTLLLNQTEKEMPPMLMTEKEDGGSTLQISIAPGDCPELLDAALTVAAEFAVKKFLGVDFDLAAPEGPGGTERISGFTSFRDWYASFDTAYRAEFGTDVPEDFWENVLYEPDADPDTPTGRYNRISNILDDLQEQLDKEYETGFPVITEENQVEYYPTYGAYMIGEHCQPIYFDDYRSSFVSWYNRRCPESPLTPKIVTNVLEATENEELSMAYWDLFDEMNKEYEAALEDYPGAEGLLITRSGNILPIPDLYGYQRCLDACPVGTTTQRILTTARSLGIDSLDMTVEYDREGALVGASGKACLTVADFGEWLHDLTISFSVTADYGNTKVEPLDLSGLVPENEYYANFSKFYALEHPHSEETVPETIVFDGKTYSTKIAR